MEDDKRGVPPPEGEGSPEVSKTPEVTAPDVSNEVVPTPAVEVVTQTGLIRRPPPPPPPPAPLEPEDEEEDKMLRMSFMEHLEELRNRIIRALYGLGIAFVLSLGFANKLWDFVSDPAIDALKHLHVNPPRLAILTPMEGFFRHLGGAAAVSFRVSRLALDCLSALGVHLPRAFTKKSGAWPSPSFF